MRILVVDDEPINIKLIELKLKKEGYDIVPANDGKEGIEKIVTHQPDLIITDLMMPYVNGMDIIHYVRNVLHKDLPIVVLTAIEDEEVLLQAFEKGANDYLIKPFRAQELSLRVKKLLHKT